MAGRIGSLILKDPIQFARDKTILVVVFWLYTLEVLICGYGMTFEVKDLPVAVVDTVELGQHGEVLRLRAHLLGRLAQGSRDHVLVTVAGAAG